MEATVQEVMNTEIATVRDDMPVEDLAFFLIDREISGAPVVDTMGRLVGVVSLTDIAQSDADRTGSEKEVGPSAFFAGGWEVHMSREDLRGLRVGKKSLLVRDIMTPTVYTVPEDTPVQKIARTMYTGRIHRLLVTRNEKVVGIVTSLDLLKLLCE